MRMVTREAYDAADAKRRASAPGLVLLYASDFSSMPAAYPFRKDEVVVGRDAACDVVLRDEAVSRRHATFKRVGEAWHIVDHGTRNGTLVDGARVTSAIVRQRSRIRLGDVIATFVQADAEAYAPYALDGLVRGAPTDDLGDLVGGLQIRTLAGEVARVAPTDLTCMVYGETGTGKERVARALHRLSGRDALQIINCAAIPTALFESELFGHKRGAFSGADRDKPGLVHAAQHGTLFLDEIGELPLEVQAKLLRFVETGEVLPLGATRAEIVATRIVTATHRDLSERVASGHFREDLLARLNEHSFVIPPLRERKEDIFMLASSFLRRYAKRPLRLSFDIMDALLAYDWPLNVRELESAIKRAAALCETDTLTRSSLPAHVLAAAHGRPREEVIEEEAPFHRGAPTEAYLRGLLGEENGNIAAVARRLGKRRMQVQRWMSHYGIAPSEYRAPSNEPGDVG